MTPSNPEPSEGRQPSLVRRGIRRLADPSFVSWPLFWVSLVIFTLDGLPTFLGGGPQSLSQASSPQTLVTSVVASQAGLFATLLAARWTVLRVPWSRRHPAVAVWTIVIGTLVGHILTVISTSQDSGTQRNANLEFVLYRSTALVVMAAMLTAIHDHRALLASLNATRASLTAARDAGMMRLNTEIEGVRAEADRVIRAAFDALRLPTADAVTRLQEASDEALRPLSHSLADRPPPVELSVPRLPRPQWRDVLADIAATPLIAPRWTAIIITLLTARLTFRDVTGAPAPSAVDIAGTQVGATADVRSLSEALLGLAAIFIAVLVSAWIVRVIARLCVANRGGRGRWAISFMAVLAITAMAQVLAGLLLRLPGMPDPPALSPLAHALLVVPVALVSVTLGLIRAFTRAQASVTTQVQQANDELTWEIARVNEDLWASRRVLAAALHGPFRAAFTSGALELAAAARAGLPDDVLRTTIAERIKAARLSIDDRQWVDMPVHVIDVISVITQLWSGVCEVTVHTTPWTIERLDADAVCSRAISSLIGEACANATTHGGATRISIELAIDGNIAHVSVSDNGTFVEPEPVRGLGSAMLDDITTAWSIDRAVGGTVLRAAVPVT